MKKIKKRIKTYKYEVTCVKCSATAHVYEPTVVLAGMALRSLGWTYPEGSESKILRLCASCGPRVGKSDPPF